MPKGIYIRTKECKRTLSIAQQHRFDTLDVSKETRAKLSKAATGKNNPMYGVSLIVSQETRVKQSKAAKNHKPDCPCSFCKAKRGEHVKSGSPLWKENWDDLSYTGLHTRIIKLKGHASNYKCIDCKKQADDWSNKDHLYDSNPASYQPRCKSCHRQYDYKLKQQII